MPDLVARAFVGALAGLGRDEEAIAAFTRDPRRETQLRIPVARRDIEVIDAVREQRLERAIRLGLRYGR